MEVNICCSFWAKSKGGSVRGVFRLSFVLDQSKIESSKNIWFCNKLQHEQQSENLQGEEEEEDLGVGDIFEENWRCSVKYPITTFHNIIKASRLH